MLHKVTLGDLADDLHSARNWEEIQMLDGFYAIFDCPNIWEFRRLRNLLSSCRETSKK